MEENNTQEQSGYDQKFWRKSWDIHLDQYLNATPRLGIYLEALFNDKLQSCLEIGCGSGRDSAYLARKGKLVCAVDYEEKVIKKIKLIFKDIPNLHIQIEDAFNLSFKDKTFDLSFHNGFFILFPEDEKIFQLLKEQERITRKYLVFAVHNNLNKKLFNFFRHLAIKDKLYDVRFFSPQELIHIIERSGIYYTRIYVHKFGGITDAFYQKKIKGLPNPFSKFGKKLAPCLYKYLPWRKTERILIVVELDS